MAKKKIFISSVQTEFSFERQALHEYICADPLLGKFFDPFLFELLPAIDQRADSVYLKEVQQSDIYLGLFGKSYGSENESGVSPTEMEFDQASQWFKTRLVFLSHCDDVERHPKEIQLINKAQDVLVRKKFSSVDELKSAVYASLVRYLEEKEIIRIGPFDASLHESASLSDIDQEKLQSFVRLAQAKRGFPLAETETAEKILTHLNLYNNNRLTRAALLLFGKEPQRFFISSEVRCASFTGLIAEKPIPSYKVFKGTVFELVDQSLEFVLNKLDYRVETRAKNVSIPGSYEIPKEVVAEAIVNAIAHRDYTSNGSVQVMIFRDRIEVWNPGSLPLGWTTEKLKQLHTSVPANPLLAEPLYLAGYIERMGTGTTDMVRESVEAGLVEPQFIQQEDFRSIIYRPSSLQVKEQVKEQVKTVVQIMEHELSVIEMMDILGLKGRRNFLQNYLQLSLAAGYVEMTQPDSPNSPTQKYRLTAQGMALKLFLQQRRDALK